MLTTPPLSCRSPSGSDTVETGQRRFDGVRFGDRQAAWRTLRADMPGRDAFRVGDWRSFEAQIDRLSLGEAPITRVRAKTSWRWAITPQEAARTRSSVRFLLICLDGSLTVWLEGAAGVTLSRGQSLVLDTARVWRLSAWAGADCLTLPLADHEIDTELTTTCAGVPLVLTRSVGVAAILQTLVIRTCDALAASPIEGREARSLHAQLSRLASQALAQTAPAKALPSPHQARMVERVRMTVARRASDATFGPGALAADLGVTLRYLNALCQMLGQGPAAYIRQIRLHIAWDRLTDPDETRAIQEIARLSGFNDAAQFSTSVKKGLGQAPRDIRREWNASRQPTRKPRHR